MESSPKLLNRKEAAAFLDISTRTLDRYVSSKRINFIRQKGILYFPERELEIMKKGKEIHNLHIVHNEDTSISQETSLSSPEKYKILWEQAKEDIVSKDQLLMELHHRLGYLESEMKNSVPLLESQNTHHDFENTLAHREQEIWKLRKKIQEMKVGKVFFLILFFLVGSAGMLFFLTQNNI